MRVVVYTRAEDGGRQAESVRKTCRGWATSAGHVVVRDITEVQGAPPGVGPGLLDALKMVAVGAADALLVANPAVFTQAGHVRQAVLAAVAQAGGRVLTVDGQPDPAPAELTEVVAAAWAVFGVFADAAHVQRLQEGRRRKRDAGGYAGHGSPPYGWHVERGQLVEHVAEQRVLARIHELRTAGLSLRQIATQLEIERLPPKRGTRWHPETVARIIRRTGEQGSGEARP